MTIREELRDSVLWLTLDRPEKLNAFLPETYRALRIAVERSDANAIVLTGSGRAFSAGADRSLIDGTASEEELALAGDEFRACLETLDACDTPIIVAVNGVGVGIGSTILLHTDLVVMAESARLRFPFTALGMVPEAGSSALLPALTRWGDTAWAMLSSEWIDASTALAMGLAWRVVPDGELMAETERVAATIAALDPSAVAATKRLLTEGRADVVRAAMDREEAAMRSLRQQT